MTGAESSAPQVPAAGLARRLGTGDAIVIGLGSMIGAGIFAVFAPAASVAGSGLLIGLAIAAVVAFCNATSSAQLAAQYPQSGGTYLYGRERLGEWAGFLAGWTFVIGKTASCAAMALTCATYAVPAGAAPWVAAAAVVALATVNCFGVTRTATATKVIVVAVLAVLVAVVVVGVAGGGPDTSNLTGDLLGHGWYGIAQSAGLVFFAFAGYARIATLGEEVGDPRRAIPRAIVTALAITLVVYVAVGIAALAVLGVDDLASSQSPLVDLATAGGGDGWATPVRIGAALAALGALLALIAGVGRTALAMARNGDLPRALSRIEPRHRVPRRAEVSLAVVVVVLVLTVDLREAIGFSSFGVLLYYLIANAAAWTQRGDDRRYPRALQIIGAVGCVVLVATLPATSIAIGVGVVAVGIGYRLVVQTIERRRPGVEI
ncbi:APC family permease [Williamsia sp. MIQD14]|uniref:APC family permease n=1 Tax=Williamsia sp. MIQD14 TaxID=3425703 RepID=UPI003DA191A8